jgi:hypothetical protein
MLEPFLPFRGPLIATFQSYLQPSARFEAVEAHSHPALISSFTRVFSRIALPLQNSQLFFCIFARLSNDPLQMIGQTWNF